MNKVILIMCFLSFSYAITQESEQQTENNDDGWETIKETIPDEFIQAINDKYVDRIKPILKTKCLDCHGSGNSLPWYANIPGPKQLIQSDIEEAKDHMDMTNDFPFLGHGTPRDDLKALSRTIKEDSMPPFRYKILHWSSSLTKEEKKAINEWIDESLNILNQSNEEEK